MGMDPLAEKLHTHSGEQGGYVGLALLAVVVVAVVTARRPLTRVVAAVGVAAWVLSLGVNLVVLGRDTGVALPWRLVEGLPLVGEIETMRFQVVVALCVAIVVALWLDALADLPAGRPTDARAGGDRRRDADVAAGERAGRDARGRPHVLRRRGTRACRAADVVETYPRSTGVWVGGARPMLWQVASGFAYRTTGGYFIGSDAQNDLLLESPVTAYQQGALDVAGGGAPPSADAATAARDELRALGVTAVAVVPDGTDVGPVLDWTRRVTGLPGQQVDDVWLFRLVVG